MQIHMVIKVWQESCVWTSTNIQPFTDKTKADASAEHLNETRTEREELFDYIEYVVESYDVAE